MFKLVSIHFIVLFSFSQSKIAFTVNREIHLMNPDGTSLVQLTNYKVPGHTPVSKNPQWTRDNKKIVFIYDPEWHGGMSLYIMNSDGTNDLRLTGKPSSKANASWSPAVSPDGTRALFISKRTNNYEIYQIEIATKKLINLSNSSENEDDPAYSSDGNWISYTRDGNLWKMKSDGSGQIKLFDGKYGHSGFSKDDTYIAFTRIEGEIATILYCRTNASDLRTITTDAISYSTVSWAPDNRQIVYLNKNEKITTIDIDGSNKNVVRNGYDPSWSYQMVP
ncbi:MAG: PD40 domain-containing protein [Calditrichaeota bacterium]|nr:PD40 domain-containing protein [Calditrichota bacterium]